MTIDTFLADLAAAARRMGYPLDEDAARLLVAALRCTTDEWSERDRRVGAMMRTRKTFLRALMLSINSGSQYIDARTMAVAIADADAAEEVQPSLAPFSISPRPHSAAPPPRSAAEPIPSSAERTGAAQEQTR